MNFYNAVQYTHFLHKCQEKGLKYYITILCLLLKVGGIGNIIFKNKQIKN